MATIRIPVPLRKLVGGSEEIKSFGRDVNECLDLLCLSYPEMKDRIFDQEGLVRRFINIFKNDEDVRFLQQGETIVQEDDVISIVPAIAGG
jgi:molybdopterin synthase sulfur carrier subunit